MKFVVKPTSVSCPVQIEEVYEEEEEEKEGKEKEREERGQTISLGRALWSQVTTEL